MTDSAVVIPTIGRPSLQRLLQSLARAEGPAVAEIIIVDDRPALEALDVVSPRGIPVRILRSGGRGPAAARNAGWRAASQTWIAFLDDDVEVEGDWFERLAEDLRVHSDVAGTQAHIAVPLPQDRPPTDWERNVAGLERAVWITADMAYRREALQRVGGFDERFRRAYREDADIALRVQRAGYRIVNGSRRTIHPVRPAKKDVSIALQRGNADDVLMRALHGPRWRSLARAPRGRMPMHLASVTAAAVAVAAALDGNKRLASVSSAAWLALTADFAWRRIAAGPRDLPEIAAMAATSAVIPFAAVYHKARGFLQLRRMLERA